MNNSDEDVVTYYDKSLAKYVIIDRKTGFSCYKSIPEFENQNQFKDEKQIVCKSLAKIDTKVHLNDKKEIEKRRLTETSDELNVCLTDTRRQTINEWCLRPDMKVVESIKLDNHWIRLDGCLRVIGQIDNKYILCLVTDRNLLLAFDQHAVHERIRYERLLNDVFDGQQNVKSVPVLPPIDIDIRLDHHLDTNFELYQRRVQRLTGFSLKRKTLSLNGSQNVNYYLTQIPQCLSDSLDIQSMIDIIGEALTIAKQTTNSWSNDSNDRTGSGLTPKLMERLQTKACRGAIRFGDGLKLHDCLKLIHSLSECRVPFRCAHGRSSVAPLAFIPKTNAN